LEKLIGGEKTVISTVEIDLSYKSFFVLGISTPRRPPFSDLIAECKEILTGMVKMLESKTVEIVENPEMISQGQKLLMSWCHSKKRFPHGPRKL